MNTLNKKSGNLFDFLPNFLIIGAAKAGTTSLYELLKQHPDVYLPFNKEPMFFSHDDNFKRGSKWYARVYFRNANRFLARGEATPHYLYWSDKVAPRIKQLYGQVPIKFIVIFREPASRAYSWYWNMVKEGQENLSFKAALKQESIRLNKNEPRLRHAGSMIYGYYRGSCYASALKPFLDLFPYNNFHFILQEDLDNDFTNTIQQLLAFLGLNNAIKLNPQSSNPASMPRSMRIQTWLRQQSGLRQFLLSFIPLRLRYIVKTSLLKANTRPSKYPNLDSEVEQELKVLLESEVRQLEHVIKRELTSWLPQ